MHRRARNSNQFSISRTREGERERGRGGLGNNAESEFTAGILILRS